MNDKAPSIRCEVTLTRAEVENLLERISHPRCRMFVEEILTLLDDISWGRAKPNHMDTLKGLAKTIVNEGDDECIQVGRKVLEVLSQSEEVFTSHIETKNCPTADCSRLTPAPCQMACPAGLDIPSYVTLIGMGCDEEAIEIIREDNPFPWVCGLVCTHPCEVVCVRGKIDTPIAIKNLKGFAAERVIAKVGGYKNPKKAPPKGKKVAIIGAGPAGLTAAYYLALKGYGVTVIDALPVAGGMMMVGIPRYRLPREVIDREVDMIRELGVEFKLNTRLGRDLTIENLKDQGFEAILIAIGAHGSYKLNIPGEDDFPQVISAIDFLRKVSLEDRTKPGGSVAVIGGGNVAIDAARTCIRLGCSKVTIVYRRSRAEMPAHEEEVLQAEEEGVEFLFLTIPLSIQGRNGRVENLRCLRAILGPPDERGKRKPIPVEGSEYDLPVDCVITAIGQVVEPNGLTELPDLKWSHRGTIQVNTVTMETSIKGVFAAGDVVTGPATVIEAIGAGKRAADAIDRYLQGLPLPKRPPVPVRRRQLPFLEVTAIQKMHLQRPRMHFLDYDQRKTTFQQVELGYSEEEARREAYRCLRCDVCKRCGKCVEVCRDRMKIDALPLSYFDFYHPVQTDFSKVAEKCILCGSCAYNCPNDAMQVKETEAERVLSICGTELNRLRLEHCDECGTPIGPEVYYNFMLNRIKDLPKSIPVAKLCAGCARKKSVELQDALPIL
ncbi:MAG: NAD(P)-binding protein [Syntrophobacterales bacterium]|nr:NAD(P)-binding protein [Syntrophobacterales bacterium]